MATRKSSPTRPASKVPAPTAAAAKRKAAGAAKVPPAAPVSASAPAAEVAKPKQKLMRDSFTIPKSEYAILTALKQRAVGLARPAKKSEILRAGVAALNALSDKAFLSALNAVPSLKTGRPKLAKPAAPKAAAAKKT